MRGHRSTTRVALALVLSVSAITVGVPRADSGDRADPSASASASAFAQSVYAGYDGGVFGMDLRLNGTAAVAGNAGRLSLTLRRFDGAQPAPPSDGADEDGAADEDLVAVDLGVDAAAALDRAGIVAPTERPEDWSELLRFDVDDTSEDGVSGIVHVGLDRMAFGIDRNGGGDPLLVIDVNGRSASIPASVVRALATGETDGIPPFQLDDAQRTLGELGAAVIDPAGMTEVGAGYGAALPLLMTRLQASGDGLSCVFPCLGCVGAIISYVGSVAAVIAACGAAVVSAGALTAACVAALILHFGAMILSLSACGSCFQCID